MSKWSKKLIGLAALGGAVAGVLYYTKKNKCQEEEAFEDVFEDEDFDLDSDLKPVTDRDYVSLTPSAEAEKTEETSEEAPAEGAPAEEASNAE